MINEYRTALRKLAESCDFQTITPDEMLRDKLKVFRIRDDVLLGSKACNWNEHCYLP